MLFVSLLCLLVFSSTLIAGVWALNKSGGEILSAFGVVVASLLIYQLLPAILLAVLNDGEYVWLPHLGGAEAIAWTSIVCVVGTVSYFVGYVIPKFSAGGKFRIDSVQCGPSSAVAALLIVTGLALKIYVFQALGGSEGNVLRLSTGVRDAMGIEAISPALVLARNLSGMADAGATWLLLEALRNKRRVVLGLLIFTMVVGFTYFAAGKRLFMLWPLLAALLGFNYYFRKIKLSALPGVFVLMLSLGFFSLLFRIYAPAAAASVIIDLDRVPWANGSILRFYFFSLEFASFEALTLALAESKHIVGLFGTSVDAFFITNIQPFTYFVPRYIWPEKPDVFLDLSHAYRVFITGGRLDSAGAIAATLLGTSWTLGGWLGMLLSMFCLGVLSRNIDSRFYRRLPRPQSLELCWYAFALVVVFHLFRQGTIAWTAIISITQQVGLILGFLAIAVSSQLARARRNRMHLNAN